MNIINLFSIAINNLKKENRSSSLGYLWLILNPLVEATTYSLVFGLFFPGQVDGIDKVPWIVVGFFTWSFLASAFLGGMDGFYTNAHLVKKIEFPLESIPQIKIVQELMRFGLLFILIIIILLIWHIYPTLQWLYLFYILFATLFFLNAITKLTSVIATLVKDIQNMIFAVFQIVFWISGVVFDVNTISQTHHTVYVIAKVNPFEYVTSTWRSIFLSKFEITPSFIKYSIVFWIVSLTMYILGKLLMNKFKGDFADII